MIRLFLSKAALLIFFIMFSNILILTYLDRHFCWGNQMLTEKYIDLKQNHLECNTLFIGSSKTYRGVVPSLFDSLAFRKEKIRSYNLGVPAMSAVEAYHVIEHILNDKDLSLKWILVELTATQPGPGLLRKPRGEYFLNFRNYAFAVKSVSQSHQNKRGKVSGIGHYTINFAERLSLFGLVQEYRYNVTDFDYDRMERFQYHDRGFLSYEREIKHTITPNQIRLGKKHLNMLKDTTVILRKIIPVPPATSAKPGQVHLKKINDLINQGKTKGVTIIFYTMQSRRKNNNYIEIQSLMAGIDEPHKLDIGHNKQYPALFYSENLYNAEHLNEQGARIFTNYLAKEFNNLGN